MKRFVCLVIALTIALPAFAWADMMSVKSRKCNFRQGPSVKDKVLFQADLYYPVKVIKKDDVWVQVADFENEKAWVHSKLLSEQKALVIKREKANVREKPTVKSKKLFTAARGAAFKVIKVEGRWVLVEHADGDRGWVAKSLTWGL